MEDVREVAVGENMECLLCGDTLVRVTDTNGSSEDYREVATDQVHGCWEQLPEKADHLRLD